MANLTYNNPPEYVGADGPLVEYPLDADLRVWAGQALIQSTSNGCAILATPTASAEFLGFSKQEKDNRVGSMFGGTAASTTVTVVMDGLAWLEVAHGTTWARADHGATVYASDANTFTLSAGTNNVVIGKVVLVPESVIGAASGRVLVKFQASALRSI